MSERADLRTPCEHGRYEQHGRSTVSVGEPPRFSVCPGGRTLTPAELLPVLLPDVDWEALRAALDEFDGPWSSSETATRRLAVSARRLLAVYDGKDE